MMDDTGLRLPRFNWPCFAAMLFTAGATQVASGQVFSGPPPLPSMVPAEQYIAEEISEPWSPPAVPSDHAAPPSEPSAVSSQPSNPTAVGDSLAPTATQSSELTESVFGEEVLVEEPHPWYAPPHWLGPVPWDAGIELGLNGSSGTNEAISLRTGGSLKRESRFSKIDLSGYYNRTSTAGLTTQNNAQFDARNDWLLDEKSPWTLFVNNSLFYDEFQAFDVQLNANTGIGYRFVNEPGLSMIGRLGGGTSREFGGPDDRWVPESLFGFEYSQQLSTMQRAYGKIDYFPEWEEVGEFRLVADVGWEVELVKPSNLSLKLSASDRYDSTPNGAEPHLVNYSVLLLLKL